MHLSINARASAGPQTKAGNLSQTYLFPSKKYILQ